MADWTPPAEAKVVDQPWAPPPEAKVWTPPAEAKEVAPPSIGERIVTGMADPMVGLGQLSAHLGIRAPEEYTALGMAGNQLPATPAEIDKTVAKREADYQASRGKDAGADWWRMLGNVASPVTLPLIALPGGAVARPASLLARVARGGLWGALGGGVGGAIEPVTDGGYGAGVAKHVVGGAAAGAALGGLAGGIVKGIAGNSPAEVERFIDDAYARAIRPSTGGRTAARQLDRYDDQVKSGISSIIGNKGNLHFPDETGADVAGRLPQTLREFSSAIEQTKQSIFNRYDAMAAQAGDRGAMISPAPAVAELKKFVADPAFDLPKYRPVKRYAMKNIEALEQAGPITPSVAQQMVQNLNEGLTAFYRASSPKAAARATIDDVIANNLRNGLDMTIRDAVAPGYQALRHEYGALKAIEKDVLHRAIVFGRQDPAGGLYGRLGTLATYEELARFLTHLDPSALATAGAIKGGKKLTQYLTNPNRAVRRMFEKAEQLENSRPQTPPPVERPRLALPAPQAQGPQRWTSTGEGVIPPAPNFTMQQPSPIVNRDDAIARALGL